MQQNPVRVFQSIAHPCGYFSDRIACNTVLDPDAPELADLYGFALQHGYRRSGGHVYRPACRQCRACLACRVSTERFRPSRRQKRCLARNNDLTIEIVPASLSAEYFDLYSRYLQARHRDGGMDHALPEDFERFLYTPWSPTRFIEFRDGARLLALAVTDFCSDGLSAVYTFFDPSQAQRSLGSFAILSQIRIALEQGLPFVYLGYWIEGHPKMDYKQDYRPLEVLRKNTWEDLDQARSQPLPDLTVSR